MNKLFNLLLAVFMLAACSLVSSPKAFADDQSAALKRLPVQDAGRVKPYDTFAREALQLMYGKQYFKNAQGDRVPAIDVVFTIMLVPNLWNDAKILQINHSGLREALQLSDKKRLYFSPNEIIANPHVGHLFEELQEKRKEKEKLNPYFVAIQRLQNQLAMFRDIQTGQALRVVPPKPFTGTIDSGNPRDVLEKTSWQSVSELQGPLQESFAQVTQAFVHYIGNKMSGALKRQAAVASAQATSAKQTAAASTKTAEADAKTLDLKMALAQFEEQARKVNPQVYASSTKINAEVQYNDVDPFMWAWIGYLIAVIFLMAAWVGGRPLYYKLGWLFVGSSFLMQAYGLGVRVYLTGRPPVSNMFETVVWVPLVTVFFAMILEALTKKRVILVASCLVAILCLVLADFAPAVLDGSIEPLQPVLRDNFWLMTHVLIITASYGAFFLAFALGDILLFYYWRDENRYAKQIREGAHAIYRSIQIGVVALAAGIILGGVWADYSWGRFWSWDPKETWALIALLGYIAILHGRVAGYLKNFGTAVGAVVAFSLVVMSWYGVNFVLGAGLHTYGFGAGGVQYVTGFVALHLLAVAYVVTMRQSRLKETKRS